MITKEQKQKIIKDLTDKLFQAKAVVFADYSGLSVNDLAELRRKGREAEVEFRVAKKTLIELALKKTKQEGIDVKNMSGQIGLAFGYADVVSPAKVLYNFSKGNENLKILGGLVEGKHTPVEQILSLAELPSLPELKAQLVGALSGPIRALAGVLQGSLRGLVGALNAIKDKK